MIAQDKARLRREHLAARRKLPDLVRNVESEQICRHLRQAVAGAGTVCAYVPAPTEPGNLAILDTLLGLCPVVLLPVARRGPAGEHLALLWGRYVPGELTTGVLGVGEPTGALLSASTLAEVDVVLVPALAVDRRGVRLGRGGGFYDRSLSLCAPGTRLIAVVRDDEILDEVPRDDHDVPMTHALTPGAGLLALGGSGADGSVST